jgi:hypothetical protein
MTLAAVALALLLSMLALWLAFRALRVVTRLAARLAIGCALLFGLAVIVAAVFTLTSLR